MEHAVAVSRGATKLTKLATLVSQGSPKVTEVSLMAASVQYKNYGATMVSLSSAFCFVDMCPRRGTLERATPHEGLRMSSRDHKVVIQLTPMAWLRTSVGTNGHGEALQPIVEPMLCGILGVG